MPSSLPVRRVYDFNPNIHGWKRSRGRPKTRWGDSIKHDLHSADLNTTNAAQMVCDPPKWKAFDSGLPRLLKLSQVNSKANTVSKYCQNEKICGGKTLRLVKCRSSNVGVSFQDIVDVSGNERWKVNLAHIITDADFFQDTLHITNVAILVTVSLLRSWYNMLGSQNDLYC